MTPRAQIVESRTFPNKSTVSIERTTRGVLALKVDGKLVPGVSRLEIVHGDHGQELVVRWPIMVVQTDPTEALPSRPSPKVD